jgi:hypothetical protein
VEALEDPRALGRRDARPAVGHLDDHVAARHLGAHLDRLAGGRVAGGVLEQVGHDLVQALGVGVHRQVGGLDRHPHLGGPRVQAGLVGRLVQQRPEGHDRAAQRRRPRLEAGQVEQLADHPAQPLGLGEHRPQHRRIGGLDAIDQVLEVRLEGRDGRAQLVGDVGHQVPAQAVHLGQLGRHLVELRRQAAHLVARGGGDPAVVVAPGDGRGGLLHLAQRRGHPPGEHPRGEQGDDDRHRRHRQAADLEEGRHLGDAGRDGDGQPDDQGELDADGGDPVERPDVQPRPGRRPVSRLVHTSAGSPAPTPMA